jgi:hypothetical protein
VIIEITAKFACDDCGTEFTVSIDPAEPIPALWSLFEVAEDACAGGRNYRDAKHPVLESGVSSVDGSRHLCHECTLTNDAKADLGKR